MLNKIELKNPNAVQKYFCEPFEKMVPENELQREQDKITAELFMTAGALPVNMDVDTKYEAKISELRSIEPYKDVERILKNWGFSYKLDFRVKFFIAFLCEQLHGGKPYQLEYLTYLQYVAWKNHKKHIDFIYFCEKVFPYGVPLVKDFEDLCNRCRVQTYHVEEPDGVSLFYPETMASMMIIAPEKIEPPKSDDDWNIMNVMKRFK